jgi:hypothetical protein
MRAVVIQIGARSDEQHGDGADTRGKIPLQEFPQKVKPEADIKKGREYQEKLVYRLESIPGLIKNRSQYVGREKKWGIQIRQTHGGDDHFFPRFGLLKPEFIIVHKIRALRKVKAEIMINKNSRQVCVIGNHIPFDDPSYGALILGPVPVAEIGQAEKNK